MDNHEAEKKIAWEAELESHRQLAKDGAKEFFAKEFPDLKHAFLEHLETVCCMDEGTAHKDLSGEAKFTLAGSGILYPAASEEERLQKVVEKMIELGVENITSHGGCGAAKLAYQRDFLGIDPDSITKQMVDDYAKAWSKKLSDKLKELGHASEFKNIELSDLERPAEFHTARMAYFDAVGGFNPNKEIDLPLGFVIERKFLPADYAAEELKVAVQIAFGDHGFDKLFTEETPFIINVFAADENELEKIKNEVAAVLADNEYFKDKRVKIDGLVI